jgi:F-type H+-transporting ATPase subunit gamma
VEEDGGKLVSKLADLQSKMRALADIESILGAMKNLSLVEMTKLSRLYKTQQELFAAISLALADFQHFYGGELPQPSGEGNAIYILIGSERGFCGAFNEEVCQRWEEMGDAAQSSKVILVGHKLALKFPEDERVLASLDGASTVEEVPRVISRLATALAQAPASDWRIVHHAGEQGPSVQVSRPLEFSAQTAAPGYPFPPLLNIPAADLRPQLFEQYLLALFYGAFYLSFMAENQERLRHMEGALNRLQEKEQQLRRTSNALRQETITEEIEVIMLSVDETINAIRG